MLKNVLGLLGILGSMTLSLPAAGQENTEGVEDIDPELVEYCKTADCRTELNVVLRLEDGSGIGFSPTLAPPAVNDGFLIIYPGEKLYIEAEVGETGPVNMKHVAEITDPDKTFVVSFSQSDGGVDMMLSITNPFEKMLKYQALMVMAEDGNIYQTSSCPVMPGIASFEMWPQPILQLFLADLKFEEPTDSMVCE